MDFLPQDDQTEYEVTLRAPEGTSLDATQVIATRVAASVRRLPEVDYTLVTVAGDNAGSQNSASI